MVKVGVAVRVRVRAHVHVGLHVRVRVHGHVCVRVFTRLHDSCLCSHTAWCCIDRHLLNPFEHWAVRSTLDVPACPLDNGKRVIVPDHVAFPVL